MAYDDLAGTGRTLRVLQIAAVGDETDDILVGVRALPASSVCLMHTPAYEEKARELRATLRAIGIEAKLEPIGVDPVLGALQAITRAAARIGHEYDEIYVNTASGPRVVGCAAMAGAFMQGAKAFAVVGGEPVFFPVMGLSYRNILSEPKFAILEAVGLYEGKIDSLRTLADLAGVEKALLSYHLRGTGQSKGLEQLGLVEIAKARRGRLHVRLTPMGRVLLAGREAQPREPAAAPWP